MHGCTVAACANACCRSSLLAYNGRGRGSSPPPPPPATPPRPFPDLSQARDMQRSFGVAGGVICSYTPSIVQRLAPTRPPHPVQSVAYATLPHTTVSHPPTPPLTKQARQILFYPDADDMALYPRLLAMPPPGAPDSHPQTRCQVRCTPTRSSSSTSMLVRRAGGGGGDTWTAAAGSAVQVARVARWRGKWVRLVGRGHGAG